MKIIKRLLLTLVAVAVVFVAALVFVANTIDPNDYKEQIRQAVKQATGRALSIDGNIELTLFPIVKLELEQVALDNPAGFEGRFAEAEYIFAQLDLLPLLQRRLEIGKVTLRKPQLTLHTRRDGGANWHDLTVAQSQTSGDASALLTSFSLAGLSVEDALIVWHDARKQEQLRVEGVALTASALASGQPLDLTFSGTLNDQKRQFVAALSFDAVVLIAQRQAWIKKLASEIEWHGGKHPLHARIRAEAELDLAADQAVIKSLSMNSEAMSLQGDARITGLSGQPHLGFALNGEHLEPRTIANALGVPARHLPAQAALDIDAEINLATDSAEIKQLRIASADAQIQGSGTVTGLLADTTGINAKFNSNTFNLAKLAAALELPLPKTARPDAFNTFSLTGDFNAETSGNKAHATIRSGQLTLGDNRLEIHGEAAWLPTLRIALDGRSERLDLGGYLPPEDGEQTPRSIPIDNLHARLSMTADKLGISVPTARIFGGRFTGNLTRVADKDTPTWRAGGTLDQAGIRQILTAFSGKEKPQLSGSGDLTYQLSANGDSTEAIIGSLSGSAQLALEKGTLNNKKLAHSIERITALFEQRSPRKNGGKLVFKRVEASFSVNKGIVDNRDLEVDTPLLHARGSGRLDLVRSRIEYLLNVGLSGKKPEHRIYIPLRIGGTLDDPDYSPDLKEALRTQAERRLKDRITREQNRLNEKATDAFKDILKDLKLPF